MTSRCPACGQGLETPLACSGCGRLLPAAPEATPFELFGLAPTFDLDPEDLRRRLLRFTRRMHPDFFGSATPAERALAERNTAELNRAHELLSDEFLRADWLLRSLGGPDEQREREMPRPFLLEVLEWNETLEAGRDAAPGTPARSALVSLGSELRARRSEVMARAGTALQAELSGRAPGTGALAEIRRLLNAVRYVDRALEELEALRLAQASAR